METHVTVAGAMHLAVAAIGLLAIPIVLVALNGSGLAAFVAGEPAAFVLLSGIGTLVSLLMAAVSLRLYRPMAQTPPRVAARGPHGGRPDDAAAAVARAVHRVDPSRPLLEVGTMQQTLSERLNAPRNVSVALATLGGGALLLAAIGLFSVINYLVTQRTHELGLRLALGATRAHIRQLIFSEIVRLTTIGIVIGMVLAAVATRLTQSFLAGIAAMNPPLFAGLVAGVALLSLAAGCWPAHRAAAIDPSIALRRES